MKRLVFCAILVVLLIPAAASLATTESLYGKYLTVADVQKVFGLKGITRKEVAITLEFYNAKNEKIIEARFDAPDFYQNEVEKNQKYYVAIPGIGEKAAYTLSSMPYRLTFVKGKYAVMTQTPIQNAKDPKNKDYLIAICKMIAGRL